MVRVNLDQELQVQLPDIPLFHCDWRHVVLMHAVITLDSATVDYCVKLQIVFTYC